MPDLAAGLPQFVANLLTCQFIMSGPTNLTSEQVALFLVAKERLSKEVEQCKSQAFQTQPAITPRAIGAFVPTLTAAVHSTIAVETR